MQWNNLPPEVQLFIVNYLDREDLKALRLTSKNLALLTVSALFHTVHLSTNTLSIDRARNISTSPHLAKNVRNLEYHMGILDEQYKDFNIFTSEMTDYHELPESKEEAKALIKQKYNNFLQEIEAQEQYGPESQSALLRSACHGFKSLESVRTTWDEPPCRDFIWRRTGMQTFYLARGDHFLNLLQAVAGSRLLKIGAKHLSWDSVSRAVAAIPCLNLEVLRNVAFGLAMTEFYVMAPDPQRDALTSFEAFLLAFVRPDVSTLELQFNSKQQRDNHDLQPISEIVFRFPWRSLTHLSLAGLVCVEDDFVTFLRKHSSTLKVLHLGDIELVPRADEDATPGSILSLFNHISRILHLESVSLDGTFSNGLDERWFSAGPDNKVPGLRQDIELWLTRKNLCPFPAELFNTDKRKIRDELEDVEGLDELETANEDYISFYPASRHSDDSWTWLPSILEEFESDTSLDTDELEEDSLGEDSSWYGSEDEADETGEQDTDDYLLQHHLDDDSGNPYS